MLAGSASVACDRLHVVRDPEHALLGKRGLPERAVAFLDLFLGLLVQRAVDDFQQRVVLPQAHPERDRDRDRADDQARAQLFEMVDEAESVFVADRANRGGHSPYEAITAPAFHSDR